nr:HAMP domain-containing sensor histidine kinase [uncultured Carboxylicivirga sp.]
MKLITKTGLNFISASIFFFLLGSLGGYYFIRYAVNKFLNNELKSAQQLIEKSHNPQQFHLSYADISVDTLVGKPYYNKAVIVDTVIVDQQTGSYEFFRKLTFDQPKSNGFLRYSILRSTAPSDLMIMKFTLMLAVFPIIFFVILYLVNRASTRNSLSVFYDTIDKLKSFDVNKDNRLNLMTSDVDEFEQLNEVFNSMDKKIKEDFERLKEYTENTSHELQTPLAIITSKIDELLQSPNLKEAEIKTLAGLMDTVSRLSKTNQALIYLAKLDNRMFSEEKEVNFVELIREQFGLLQPMIEEKNINIDFQSTDVCKHTMNPTLANTLIQNLIKNAIRHNKPNGYIKVKCHNASLIIANSGNPLDVKAEELFERFKMAGNHPLSLGIGLSIAKRICEISGINIQYECIDSEHCFILKCN